MLKYIGDGSFIPDVPARDLSEAEVMALEAALGWEDVVGMLVGSGLYEPNPGPSLKRRENKKEKGEVRDGRN